LTPQPKPEPQNAKAAEENTKPSPTLFLLFFSLFYYYYFLVFFLQSSQGCGGVAVDVAACSRQWSVVGGLLLII